MPSVLPTGTLPNNFLPAPSGQGSQSPLTAGMNPSTGGSSPLPNTPGIVPQPPSARPGTVNSLGNTSFGIDNPPGGIATNILNGQAAAINPLDPQFTQQFFNWLQQQMGSGVKPFNLSSLLPSSGQATAPGTLTAPLDQLLQQLQGFFSGKGSNVPGLNQLGDVATKGISALPTWQPMVDAMQRQIQEGATNLKEQFNFAGDLASSPFGNAITDYYTQSSKDLNAQLANLQFQGDQLQVGAEQTLASGDANLGQFLQNLDQQSIQNLYQEFIRTQPQYNPLLQYEAGASTTFPPVYGKQVGGGGIGSILQGAGSIASALPDLIGLLGL